MTAVLEPTPSMTEASCASLWRLMTGGVVFRALYVACKLHVADHLADGPKPVAELAAACEADTEALGRCLRVLADQGLFREDAQGFHLAGAGELLRSDTDSSWWSFAVLTGELAEPTPAAALYAARTGRTAFDHLHPCGFYEALAADPDVERMYNDSLAARADRVRDAVMSVVDWSDVRHVIDVGGNHGALLAGLLQRLPRATGVLFDRPHVVAGAGRTLIQAGVEERVDCVGGDFFQSVPPGGEVYLMANVVWNWPDDQAVQILRRCADAMSGGARLLVIEPVRHAEGHHEATNTMDLANSWLTNGRLRTAEEWELLLESAGLSMLSITPTATEVSVVTAARARTE